MNVLITGANGFIAKNLISTLMNIRDGKDRTYSVDPNISIYEYTRCSDGKLLEKYCEKADIVYHLAGVNRPVDDEEFMIGNGEFTEKLVDMLEKCKNYCPIVFSSSIQVGCDNLYGKSKQYAEDILKQYAEKNSTMVYIYRLRNVFGKWCKPNYNSVVATFCYNISRDMPIVINDENHKMELIYIDDVIRSFVDLLTANYEERKVEYRDITNTFSVTLGEIASLLYEFRDGKQSCYLPNTQIASFQKNLYATYLSYLPEKQFSYFPKMNIDQRGSFTELFKTPLYGQISVNVSKPGITKGEHWHHTKCEKFVVVSGEGLIQFRKYNEDAVIEYKVSGDKIEIVDIPPGYTHNIINTGNSDMVTIMWCNECFDPDKPDTYYLKVKE